MKKTVLLLMTILFANLCFVACSDDKDQKDDETSVTLESLPQQAQDFISRYFRDQTIYKIEKNEYSTTTIYSVYVEDCQIDFNEEGEWQQVDAHYGKTIPFAILPEPVQSTLKERFPGFGVNQVTKEGQLYYVVLTDDQGGDSIGLTFNQSGEIINQSLN